MCIHTASKIILIYPGTHRTLPIDTHGITAADTSLTDKQYSMLRFDKQHGLCTKAGIGQEYSSMLQTALSIYHAMFLSQALAKAEGWASTVYTSQQEVCCPFRGPASRHVRALLSAGCTLNSKLIHGQQQGREP